MHGRLQRPGRRAALIAGAAWLAGPGRAQPARVLDVVVSLPGPASTVSFPVELLVRQGLDAEQGLRVRPKFVGGGGIALEDLTTRNADFAVMGLPAAMLLRARTPATPASPVVLAAVDDQPLYMLVVRSDLREQVRQVADLRGRALGVHSNSAAARTTSHQLTELVLASHGVSGDAVRYVSVGQNWETQSAAFASRAVDAIMADEAFALRFVQERRGYALLSLGDREQAAKVPGAGFLRAVLAGRAETVEADPERAARMVRAVKAALGWIAARTPQQAAAGAGYADPAATATMERLLQANPRMYSRDGRFSGRQLRETQVFFRASNAALPAAQALALESMVVDRWAGRTD